MNLGVLIFSFCSKIRQRAARPSGHLVRLFGWGTGPPALSNIKQKQQRYKSKLRRVRFEHMSEKTVHAEQRATTSKTTLSRILWAYLCLHLCATCPGHYNVLRFITLIMLRFVQVPQQQYVTYTSYYLNNTTWPLQVSTLIILCNVHESSSYQYWHAVA
jgi:hypothetical protein